MEKLPTEIINIIGKYSNNINFFLTFSEYLNDSDNNKIIDLYKDIHIINLFKKKFSVYKINNIHHIGLINWTVDFLIDLKNNKNILIHLNNFIETNYTKYESDINETLIMYQQAYFRGGNNIKVSIKTLIEKLFKENYHMYKYHLSII